MPFEIRRKGKAYEVHNPRTGKVYARHTDRVRAKRQQRLLNAVTHSDWRPTGKRPIDYRATPTERRRDVRMDDQLRARLRARRRRMR